MRAGRLKKRVIIEQSTPTVDAIGAQVDVWFALATVFADVKSQGGREFQAARTRNAALTHAVRIRYRAGINPKMRLNLGGRYLDIKSVVDVGARKRELILMCVEFDVR